MRLSNKPARVLCLALLSLTALALQGCFDANDDDSKQPWAQPASWEGGMPGMGGGYGSGR